MKNKKGEIATLLTLGLVIVGTLITLGTSLFVNNNKNIAMNPKAGCPAYQCSGSNKCYDPSSTPVGGSYCCLVGGSARWQITSCTGGGGTGIAAGTENGACRAFSPKCNTPLTCLGGKCMKITGGTTTITKSKKNCPTSPFSPYWLGSDDLFYSSVDDTTGDPNFFSVCGTGGTSAGGAAQVPAAGSTQRCQAPLVEVNSGAGKCSTKCGASYKGPTFTVSGEYHCCCTSSTTTANPATNTTANSSGIDPATITTDANGIPGEGLDCCFYKKGVVRVFATYAARVANEMTSDCTANNVVSSYGADPGTGAFYCKGGTQDYQPIADFEAANKPAVSPPEGCNAVPRGGCGMYRGSTSVETVVDGNNWCCSSGFNTPGSGATVGSCIKKNCQSIDTRYASKYFYENNGKYYDSDITNCTNNTNSMSFNALGQFCQNTFGEPLDKSCIDQTGSSTAYCPNTLTGNCQAGYEKSNNANCTLLFATRACCVEINPSCAKKNCQSLDTRYRDKEYYDANGLQFDTLGNCTAKNNNIANIGTYCSEGTISKFDNSCVEQSGKPLAYCPNIPPFGCQAGFQKSTSIKCGFPNVVGCCLPDQKAQDCVQKNCQDIDIRFDYAPYYVKNGKNYGVIDDCENNNNPIADINIKCNANAQSSSGDKTCVEQTNDFLAYCPSAPFGIGGCDSNNGYEKHPSATCGVSKKSCCVQKQQQVQSNTTVPLSGDCFEQNGATYCPVN